MPYFACAKHFSCALERYFQTAQRGSSIRQEIIAGCTTFLAMVYSIITVPDILHSAGFDRHGVFIATCLISGVGSLLMGFWAKLPMAIGCAISLSAFTAFNLVMARHIAIPVVLGAIFIMGLLFTLITRSGLRCWLMNQIPTGIAYGTGIGIGLFLLLIAACNVGLVVKGTGEGMPIQLGPFTTFPVLMSLFGLAAIIGLQRRQVTGSMLLVIIVLSLLGLLFDPQVTFRGIVALPNIEMLYGQSLLGALDIPSALSLSMLPSIFALVLTAVFDATGTIRAVAGQARLFDEEGQIICGEKALLADSCSNLLAGIVGGPPAAVYIESAAGVSAGGRSGLTAVVVGLLFLSMLFFSPLSYLVPHYATAPALMYVGVSMLSNIKKFDFDDPIESFSGLICAVFIAFSCNVVTGIMLGFCTLLIGRYCAGESDKLQGGTACITCILFIFYLCGWAL